MRVKTRTGNTRQGIIDTREQKAKGNWCGSFLSIVCCAVKKDIPSYVPRRYLQPVSYLPERKHYKFSMKLGQNAGSTPVVRVQYARRCPVDLKQVFSGRNRLFECKCLSFFRLVILAKKKFEHRDFQMCAQYWNTSL